MTQCAPDIQPWTQPATSDQAARYLAAVIAGRAVPLHAALAPAIRNALHGLTIYSTCDMTAPAQIYSVSLGRELLKLAADQLDAADVAALSDVALVLITARRLKVVTSGES